MDDDQKVVRNQMIHDALIIVDDMKRLVDSPGWQRIVHQLEAKKSEAYALMCSAATGDQSLKSTTGFTTLKWVLDLPEWIRSSNAQTVEGLQQEEAKEAQKPTGPRRRMP